MIRDPSDGTVREPPKEEASKVRAPAIGIPITDLLEHPRVDTGLRQPTRTDAQERLEESRKWLKQYRKAIDDANRMNDKGEVPK